MGSGYFQSAAKSPQASSMKGCEAPAVLLHLLPYLLKNNPVNPVNPV